MCRAGPPFSFRIGIQQCRKDFLLLSVVRIDSWAVFSMTRQLSFGHDVAWVSNDLNPNWSNHAFIYCRNEMGCGIFYLGIYFHLSSRSWCASLWLCELHSSHQVIFLICKWGLQQTDAGISTDAPKERQSRNSLTGNIPLAQPRKGEQDKSGHCHRALACYQVSRLDIFLTINMQRNRDAWCNDQPTQY